MVYTHERLLGETLKQAGLISDLQIQTVLEDRKYSNHLRVGEIMALRGWIRQKTADFFAEEWHHLINQSEKYPLGYYLEKSGLLTDQQIDLILAEQKKIWVKFGAVAVLQGALTKETVDFFLDSLFPFESLDSPLIGKKINEPIYTVAEQINLIIQTPKEQSNVEENADYDDIPWID